MKVFLFSLAAAFGGSQEPTLTIEQAMAIAEVNSFAVRTAESNVRKSRARVSEAKGQLGPKVTVGANYTRFLEDRVSFGPPGTSLPKDSKSATASLSMPINIGSQLNVLVRANEALLRAAEQNLRAARADARLSAQRAFLALLRAEALVMVQQQALTDAEERLANARLLFQGGQIARVDVQRFEAQAAQSRQDLITAQNAQVLATNALNLALARPIETPVDPGDIQEAPPVPETSEELVRRAQEQRPEAMSLLNNIVGLQHLREAQERAHSPGLSFSLNHQRNLGQLGFGSQAASSNAMLALSWNVFDSGLSRARVQQAREDEAQARIQYEGLLLGISQEVRAALANMQSALARLENARRQLALAEEVFRLAKVREEAGSGITLEVIDAQTQLTVARSAVANARYDTLIAHAELQRATGVGAPNTKGTEEIKK